MDIPALLRAQDIPRPAYLQVLHRNPKPRPQLTRIQHRTQPLLRRLSQAPRRRHHQVAVRPPRAPAHAPTKLVQLRQPQRIRPVDDQRVHIRNIQPRLDDSRAHQHIQLPLRELQHHILKIALVHLPVPHAHTRLRHQPAQMPRHVINVIDSVVQEIHLPLTVDLP